LHNRHRAFRDGLILVAAILTLGAIFAVLFGPRRILFQMLIEPLHLPWQRIEMGRWNAAKFFLWELW
jgi:hypothetical protein